MEVLNFYCQSIQNQENILYSGNNHSARVYANSPAFTVVSSRAGGGGGLYLPSTSTTLTRNVWRGMRGNDVKKLQQLFNSIQEFKLAESGPGSPGNETSYYGFLLESAVQNFQCKYGIACSGSANSNGYGVVGPQTRVKIQGVFGASPPIYSAPVTPTPIPESTISTTTSTSALQQQIQQMMKQLQIIREQLKVLQGAMVHGVFGR